jgi:phosphotriesterase-related protein
MLERGAYVQVDLIGWKQEWEGSPTDAARARRLARLVALGYEERLLVSTDTCRLSQLHANGGRGFDHLPRIFVPMLRGEGVSERALDAMLRENPQRVARLADGRAP